MISKIPSIQLDSLGQTLAIWMYSFASMHGHATVLIEFLNNRLCHYGVFGCSLRAGSLGEREPARIPMMIACLPYVTGRLITTNQRRPEIHLNIVNINR